MSEVRCTTRGGGPSPNRLIHETSPYLLQHAGNPVDWYPWGEEALSKARAENKPIFLSIGYAACHWCHVMEHESFEDQEVASILNRHFVNIKVDREERPDLDDIYMTAVQMLTGSGGWPMSVFLTPDRKPFFAGTYFPREEQFGRIGFKTLLGRLIELWEHRRGDIDQSAEEITRALAGHAAMEVRGSGHLSDRLIENGASALESDYDPQWGGFGGAPKFPPSSSISILLRTHKRTREPHWMKMADHTLECMAYGGLYDQVGGGFHRYSVDEQWLVPHFEKMLYDNALLTTVYLEAWQATGNALYERIARETLEYVLRDMTDQKGGFHSSEDADSEGKEGRFYVWTREEICSALGPDDGHAVCHYFGVTEEGNFEGANILHVARDPIDFARSEGMAPEPWMARLDQARMQLREARDKRVHPGRDDKVLVSWNGLMISAFARGAQALGDKRYAQAAGGAAAFILENMRPAGRLKRAWRAGRTSGDAYLDDYAFLIQALIDLYETTHETRWLEEAVALAEEMIELFHDQQAGNFFLTSKRHTDVLLRPKSLHDGSEPSGNAVAALGLLRLARYFDRDDFRAAGEGVLKSSQGLMENRARGMMNMLSALDFHRHPDPEFVVVGRSDDEQVRTFLHAIRRRFLPNKVLALHDPDAADAEKRAKEMPLLAGKTLVDGQVAVYVCRNYACEKPITTTEELDKALGP